MFFNDNIVFGLCLGVIGMLMLIVVDGCILLGVVFVEKINEWLGGVK